jgi:hypothetical protein
MSNPPWHKYRVFCLESIVTGEGDLIIAGTPGTVLHWIDDDFKKVMVAWDHYMFFDNTDDIDYGGDPKKKQANTHIGLIWEVPVEKLRWHGP